MCCACSICRRLRSALGSDFVVGHLKNEARDVVSKQRAQFFLGCLRVLDGIVECSSREDRRLVDAGVNAQHVHERDRVIDVRACVAVFAPLHPVLLRGELDGANHQTDVVGSLHYNTLTLSNPGHARCNIGTTPLVHTNASETQ